MPPTPTTWSRIAAELAAYVAELKPANASPYPRILIDAAPAGRPGELAEAVAEELRPRGRPALVIPAEGFLRSASLRFEHGKQDPDAYLDGWLDTGALWREVFDPLEAGGSGRVLPDLWNPVTDRATRSAYVEVEPGTAVIVCGARLLGRWFPFDLSVHVSLSVGALRRRTPEEEQWMLAAFTAYDEATRPGEVADVVIRADDPRRPAWSGLP